MLSITRALAKSHRMAAEHHGKGEHEKGREHASQARAHSKQRMNTPTLRTARAHRRSRSRGMGRARGPTSQPGLLRTIASATSDGDWANLAESRLVRRSFRWNVLLHDMLFSAEFVRAILHKVSGFSSSGFGAGLWRGKPSCRSAMMKRLVLGGDWVARRMKAMRFHLIALPGRVVRHARRLIVRLSAGALDLIRDVRATGLPASVRRVGLQKFYLRSGVPNTCQPSNANSTNRSTMLVAPLQGPSTMPKRCSTPNTNQINIKIQ